MKIDIEEEKNLVYVRVQLNRPKEGRFEKFKLRTKDILQILSQKKIAISKCIKAPPVVTNKKNDLFLFGEWIFEKPKKPVRSRKKPKKVEKTLDKSSKDVIIDIQEKTLPPKEE